MKRKWLFALMATLLVLCFAVPAMAVEQWDVQLVWNDNNNADGERPTEVDVTVVFRDSSNENGFTRRSAMLNAGNDWNSGYEIIYFVDYEFDHIEISHDKGAYYTYTVDTDLSHGKTTVTLTLVTSISGSIIWNDANDQDGKRPDEVTVRLHKNGTEIQSTTISGNRTDNRWQYAFTNLPKYENGSLVPYSVGEDAVDSYSTDIDNYTITNSHTPETTSISGSIVWDDADNQDGIRPESVTVQLFADGAALVDKILTLSESNGWQGSFDNLDQYENGSKITYTLAADNFTGYTRAITGDAASGYTITYSHTPAKTGVWCQAVWNDSNNQDGIRPNEVTVKLLADGVDSGKSLTLNAGNAWTHSFNDLPKYECGREISYTIAVTIDDYTSAITGTATTGYTITNSHTPDTINVAGEITWNDDNDRDRKRPASVTVRLLANAVEVDQKTVTPDANGNWSFSFDGVAKYKNGQPIQYKVYLDSLDNGYSTGTDGYNPIAIRTPDKRSVYGSIIWDDDNNRDGKRPASVIVRVFQGNTELNHQTVTPDDEGYWVYSFANLLKTKTDSRSTIRFPWMRWMGMPRISMATRSPIPMCRRRRASPAGSIGTMTTTGMAFARRA